MAEPPSGWIEVSPTVVKAIPWINIGLDAGTCLMTYLTAKFLPKKNGSWYR